MTQDTKSPNGVLLQRRLITFDARRKPAEVLIYDGRNQYRYRGVFLYDQAGRFVEEQLYDTNNQILRRRVQEYETNGSPKRIWVTDHARNIPEDLKLIITEEHDSEAAQRNYERFRREAREVKKNADRSETGKKKGFFGRILGGRK